jgi:hypothetical protein
MQPDNSVILCLTLVIQNYFNTFFSILRSFRFSSVGCSNYLCPFPFLRLHHSNLEPQRQNTYNQLTFSMKHVLQAFCLLLSCAALAQKVDIDKFYVNVNKASLPDNYVDPAKRSFSIRTTGDRTFANAAAAEPIQIFGWTRQETGGDMEIVIKALPFERGQAQSSSRKEEKKDDNGKIISSVTYYSYACTHTGKGAMTILGEKNSYSSHVSAMKKAERDAKRDSKKKDKDDEKKKDKDDEKEAPPADNPFLKNVDTSGAAQSDAGDLAPSTKTQAYIIDVSKGYPYNTREYTKSSEASAEWTAASASHYSNSWNGYQADIISMASGQLNSLYGYRPVKERLRFDRIDSDKHAEFSNFDNATKALGVILAKTRYNQSVEQISKDIQPVIDYFEKLATKLELSKEKADKKVRAAAWYNLAQIYYCIDQHDKAIAISNKIVASEYDEKDGTRFIKKCESARKMLEFHKMASRHIIPRNAAEEKEVEGEAVEDAEDK